MNNEKKTQMCNCKEIEKKLISLLKDNGKLSQMIRDLRGENERLTGELARPDTGDNNAAEVRSLVEINHGWKRDYEDLQMRYEMLSGEKRSLEEEAKELKESIGDLEKRQGPLESEITLLKTQITVYKEVFERERRDREKIHEQKEKLKRELESAEDIIKMLTTELDASREMGEERRSGAQTMAAIRGENGYLPGTGSAGLSPRHQLQPAQPFATGMSGL